MLPEHMLPNDAPVTEADLSAWMEWATDERITKSRTGNRMQRLIREIRRLQGQRRSLIEACKALLADARCYCPDEANRTCDPAEICPACKARAAIARAEGK